MLEIRVLNTVLDFDAQSFRREIGRPNANIRFVRLIKFELRRHFYWRGMILLKTAAACKLNFHGFGFHVSNQVVFALPVPTLVLRICCTPLSCLIGSALHGLCLCSDHLLPGPAFFFGTTAFYVHRCPVSLVAFPSPWPVKSVNTLVWR